MTNLVSFFDPRSVAVLGASEDVDKIGTRVLNSIIRHGYSGKIYPINKKRSTIQGLTAYAAIGSVPDRVDLAIICVPANSVPGVIGECASAGVKNAIIVSSGFAEACSSGQELEAQLRKILTKTKLRICGPNAEGFFNVDNNLAATFSPAIDVHMEGASHRNSIGIVSQSGGIGFSLFNKGAQEGLSFSKVVSVGNEVDLDLTDFADAMLDDAATGAIMIFSEGFRVPSKFVALAQKANELGKPLIVAKAGRSKAGARAVMSHTSSVSGSETGYCAIFERYGVLRADDQEHLLDIAAAMTRFPRLSGNRVAIITTSGGTGAWLADLLSEHGFEFPDIDESRKRLLAEFLPSYGSALNPVDVTGQGRTGLQRSLEVLQDAAYLDAIVIVASFAHEARLLREGAHMAEIALACGKPVLLFSYTAASEKSKYLLRQWGLHLFSTMHGCVRALKAMDDYRKFVSREREGVPHRMAIDIPKNVQVLLKTASGRPLCEYEAKSILEGFGIDCGQEILAGDVDQAIAAARRLGWPVALKLQSPDIVHKSDAGAVRLNIGDAKAVGIAYEEILASAKRFSPQAEIRGVLVQRMAKTGREMIVGMMRDPDLGPLIMCGLGGVHVEILKDVVFAPVPLRKPEALRMIGRLKSVKILEGVRGERPADIEALADLMVKISELVESIGDQIQEIDLNPVIIYPAHEGLSVVDALIVPSSSPDISAVDPTLVF